VGGDFGMSLVNACDTWLKNLYWDVTWRLAE
jgi:hypothetical protein